MGTHPIFESDFDCLTEKKSRKIRTQKKYQKRFERGKERDDCKHLLETEFRESENRRKNDLDERMNSLSEKLNARKERIPTALVPPDPNRFTAADRGWGKDSGHL